MCYYKYTTRAAIEEKFKPIMVMSSFSFDDYNYDIFVAYGRTSDTIECECVKYVFMLWDPRECGLIYGTCKLMTNEVTVGVAMLRQMIKSCCLMLPYQ